jgi:hypothetical protein
MFVIKSLKINDIFIQNEIWYLILSLKLIKLMKLDDS